MKLKHGSAGNMGTHGKTVVPLWQIWFPYLVAEIALQMSEKGYVFLKEFPLVYIDWINRSPISDV